MAKSTSSSRQHETLSQIESNQECDEDNQKFEASTNDVQTEPK